MTLSLSRVVFDGVGPAVLDAAATHLIVEQRRAFVISLLHHRSEQLGVAGESLQQNEVRGEAEDGDAGARRRGLEVGKKLLVNVGLVGDGRIECVE